MIGFLQKNSSPQQDSAVLNIHPILRTDFMRQEIILPLKKGRCLVQFLTNQDEYCREIYYSKERNNDGTNKNN